MQAKLGSTRTDAEQQLLSQLPAKRNTEKAENRKSLEGGKHAAKAIDVSFPGCSTEYHGEESRLVKASERAFSYEVYSL